MYSQLSHVNCHECVYTRRWPMHVPNIYEVWYKFMVLWHVLSCCYRNIMFTDRCTCYCNCMWFLLSSLCRPPPSSGEVSGSELLLLELASDLHCTAAAVHWSCSASSLCGHQKSCAVKSSCSRRHQSGSDDSGSVNDSLPKYSEVGLPRFHIATHAHFLCTTSILRS